MINSNQLALLELLKATLFHIEPSFPADTDWDAVLQEAKDHAVVTLAAPSVPQAEAHKWQPLVDQNTAHTLQVLHAQGELVKLFASHGIPLVILKGTAAAVYYPNPVQRTMGDIDFIVPPEQFSEARQLLLDSGYAENGGDDTEARHVAYERYGVLFELHRSFSSFGIDIDSAIADGLSRAERSAVLGAAFPMLPSPENGLVLLAHIRQHLIEEFYSLGLRQVVDWMMYVHTNFGDDGWADHFKELLQKYRLDKLAATMTYICNTWLGLPETLPWAADESAAAVLFDRILASGNFGKKLDWASLKSTQVQNTAVGIRQYGFFGYLQYGGIKNWQAAQKCRFLRPFAWLYQLFRYIGIALTKLFSGERFAHELIAEKKESDFKNRIGV